MKALGSVASLVEALREEVESECDRIRQETRAQKARLQEAAAAQAIELPGRGEQIAAQRQRAAELLAREDWADRRENLEDREEFVSRAARQGLERLAQTGPPQARREILVRWICEGLRRLPGEDFEVVLTSADAPLFGSDCFTDLARTCGKREVRLAAGQLEGAGGCVVRSRGGRAAFDNTIEARIRRFEFAWRAALSEIYES